MSPIDELARRVAWAEWRLQWAEWKIAELERHARSHAPLVEPALGDPSRDDAAAARAPAPSSPNLPEASLLSDPSAANPQPPDAARAAPASAFEPAFDPTFDPTTGAPRGAVSAARGGGEAAGAPPSPPAVASPFDWESLIGVRLFAWLGGAAFFVGAALFLNYSIQQNLISPALRVALALGVGAVALVGGDRLRAKADRAGQAIAGAGVAILYAALFAARSLYSLIPTSAAFAGMILVTAVAGLMAVRRDAFMLAILGLLGGFLTPYLLASGEDRPLALFAYVALLDAGVVLVTAKKRWPTLALLGLAGSGLLYAGWSMRFMSAAKAPYALAAAAALAAVFALGAPLEERSAERGRKRTIARATAATAAILPLLLAVIVSGGAALDVSPYVLVPYVLVLSAGAWIAGRRAEIAALPSAAAVLSAATLGLRADATLFPDHRVGVLAVFAAVPAAYALSWIARRRGAEEGALRVAAVLALTLTPLLVLARAMIAEEGERALLPVAAYAAAHVALLAAMGVVAARSKLVLAAEGLSVAALLLVSFGFDEVRLAEFLPAVLTPMVAFWSLPLLGPRFRADRGAWLGSALALVLHFPFLYVMARPVWGEGALGASSVACGLLALVAWRQALRVTAANERDALHALLGGVALLFFTAAFPIVLSNEWLTVAWALEAAALAWLRGRAKHVGLLIAPALLGGATFARLLLNPAVVGYHARSGTPIFNWWLYTYGVSAAALLATAWLLRDDEAARRYRAPAAFATAGGVLLFVLLNIEIADLHSTGESVRFAFSGGGLAEDMTYTLAWLVFGVGLFALGILRSARPVRMWGLLLLCLSAAKAALHDLWALGSLYRVGAIIGLAFALLAVSFLTQRFVLRKEPS